MLVKGATDSDPDPALDFISFFVSRSIYIMAFIKIQSCVFENVAYKNTTKDKSFWWYKLGPLQM